MENKSFWEWLWGNSPKERNAILDQAGKWPVALMGFRSYRAQAVTPAAAPNANWMQEAGSYSQVGNIMPVSLAFVQKNGTAAQLNLPLIGPTNEDPQRASALQAALAASLSGMQTLPR